VGDLLAEGGGMIEVGQAAMDAELIDHDVRSGRERIPQWNPNRLEEASERAVQGTSVAAGTFNIEHKERMRYACACPPF
jgi:hypothetical protein